MTYFWAQWRQYNKVLKNAVIILVIVLGVAAEMWLVTQNFFNPFNNTIEPQTNYRAFTGAINTFLAGYWFTLFLIFILTDVFKVFVFPIRQNYIIEEITQQYSRKQVYFTKISYLILSIFWKWALALLFAIIGLVVITGGDSELIGFNFTFLITGFFVLLLSSIGITILLSSFAIYLSTTAMTLFGGVLLGMNILYVFIILFASSIFPGIRWTTPEGAASPVLVFDPRDISLATYNFLFAATSWFNINYQFNLVVALFQGNAFLNILQIFTNSEIPNATPAFLYIFTPRRFSEGTSLGLGVTTLVDQGNFLNPYAVMFGWGAVAIAMYGINFRLFAKRDFN